MDGFERNKIMMAVLLALLIGMTSSKISDLFISPVFLEKPAIEIEGVQEADTPGDGKEEALEPIEPLLVSASVEKGQTVAKKCLQCHSFEKGGPTRTGPNLYNIIDAPYGHVQGFPYSKALLEKKETWTVENLNAFLHKPRKHISGTKMAFAGLKSAEERANVIAYLNSNSDSPKVFGKS